jgi:hypothetical protein
MTRFRNVITAAVLAMTACLTCGIASAQTIDMGSTTFKPADLAVNQNTAWGPIILGSVLRMTNKQQSQISTVYAKKPMNITKFNTTFEAVFYCDSADESDCADGVTFVIQNNDTKALGNGGGQLGYGGIDKSVAFKFDTAQNTEFTPPDPSNDSVGVYKNGEIPCGGSDVSEAGIDFRHHDPMSVTLNYDGKILHFFMTDIRTGAHVERSYPINIPETIGSKTAYVGFTAACGLGCSEQDILRWKYSSPDLPAGTDVVKPAIQAASAQASAK